MPNLTLEVTAQDPDARDVFIGRTMATSITFSSEIGIYFVDFCADRISSLISSLGVLDTYTFPLSGENGQVMPDGPELEFSVKFNSLGAEEPIGDLVPMLKQASDTLRQLKGLNAPGVPEKSAAAGSEVASIKTILEKIGNISDTMDEQIEVCSYIAVIRTSGLIRYIDLYLHKSSLRHHGPLSEGKFLVTPPSDPCRDLTYVSCRSSERR